MIGEDIEEVLSASTIRQISLDELETIAYDDLTDEELDRLLDPDNSKTTLDSLQQIASALGKQLS